MEGGKQTQTYKSDVSSNDWTPAANPLVEHAKAKKLTMSNAWDKSDDVETTAKPSTKANVENGKRQTWKQLYGTVLYNTVLTMGRKRQLHDCSVL